MLRERERCKFLWEKEKIEPKRIYMKISFGCPSMSNTGGGGEGVCVELITEFRDNFPEKASLDNA